MEVIVITTPGKSDDELSKIIQLFEHGLDALHLRKPKFSTREIEEFILAVPEKYRSLIVIYGHYDLAVKYRLKGVHLKRKHRSSSFRNWLRRLLLKIRRRNLLISTTFHSLQSLQENAVGYDYAFLSQVFTSHTHYNSHEAAGINLLKTAVLQSKIKVYATGGVTTDKLPVIHAAGFHGVGLSSAVLKTDFNKSVQKFELFRAA